jgi:hypothetical protein
MPAAAAGGSGADPPRLRRRRSYLTASTFFNSYNKSLSTTLAAEIGVIKSPNASCSAYATARGTRKRTSATIYFLMCVDGNTSPEPSNALTGGLRPTSKVALNLELLHQASPPRAAAPCCLPAMPACRVHWGGLACGPPAGPGPQRCCRMLAEPQRLSRSLYGLPGPGAGSPVSFLLAACCLHPTAGTARRHVDRATGLPAIAQPKVGTCLFSNPCTHFIPDDDKEAEFTMGLIQGMVENWAAQTSRNVGAPLLPARARRPTGCSRANCLLTSDSTHFMLLDTPLPLPLPARSPIQHHQRAAGVARQQGAAAVCYRLHAVVRCL